MKIFCAHWELGHNVLVVRPLEESYTVRASARLLANHPRTSMEEAQSETPVLVAYIDEL